ncbi:MAG: hypothetical protein EG823_00905 [Actinobacteria bacterium]|nr:hypothetical protein [Actinomycetota bacterium]
MEERLRIGLRMAGIVATAAAFVGVAFMLYVDSKVAGSVVARPASWVAPVAAVLALAGVAWILLSERQRTDDIDIPDDRAECPSCGREIHGAWRICPFCGDMPGRVPLEDSGKYDQHDTPAEGGRSWQE